VGYNVAAEDSELRTHTEDRQTGQAMHASPGGTGEP